MSQLSALPDSEREQTTANKKRIVVKYTQGIVQLEDVRKTFKDLDLVIQIVNLPFFI